MRSSSILTGIATIFATTVVGHKHHAAAETATEDPGYSHFACGTSIGDASHHFNQTVAALHANRHSARSLTHNAALYQRAAASIVVPTVFHVVTKAASAGTITSTMIAAQIAEMNTAYNPYGISYNLINTTYTANDAWAVAAGADMTAMQAALRQGSYTTLNIYFHTDLAGGLLGICSLPSDIGPGTPAASVYAADGCSVSAHTMPGGSINGYNLGKTAVHETGHWMGLLHTFEGYSCAGTGDFIADTPVQSTSTDGCPSKPPKDSCPTVTGVDPIHNYMDYSTDVCYTGFTQGQQARMVALWAQYRLGR